MLLLHIFWPLDWRKCLGFCLTFLYISYIHKKFFLRFLKFTGQCKSSKKICGMNFSWTWMPQKWPYIFSCVINLDHRDDQFTYYNCDTIFYFDGFILRLMQYVIRLEIDPLFIINTFKQMLEASRNFMVHIKDKVFAYQLFYLFCV